MTVAPAMLKRRRLLTAAEFAVRWQVREQRASAWLQDFEARGYATRRGEFWVATQRAKDLNL